MTTICGHDREMLTWALQVAIKETILDMPGIAILVQSLGSQLPAIAALAAIGDPSKLAELLVDEGGRLGLEIGPFVGHGGPEWMVWPDESDLIIDGCDMRSHRVRRSIAQARAILAAWLALPDGACEDAEKVLRGGQ